MFHWKRLAVSAAAALSLALSANTVGAQQIGIAAGQQGSQNYATNAALAKVLGESAGLDMKLESYGGSGQYLPLIHTGEIDIAAVVDPDAGPAYLGTGPFEGLKMDNLRVLARLAPTRVGIMVQKDSDIKTLDDLRGKRVTYGMTAQPTLAPMVDAILANGGLSANDVEPVRVASVRRGADEFLSGNADAVFFALRSGKMKEVDAQVGGIRWLDMSDSDEAIARMREHVGTAYIINEPVSETQVGIAEPTNVMGFDYILIGGAHLSDDIVRKIVSTLHDNPETVAGSARSIGEFTTGEMAKQIPGLIYHPAAEAFYKEKGLWPSGS